MRIRRGHVYTADLNPRFGSEPGKVRPVLVLQTDLINTAHSSTLVCLLTTKVRPEAEILRVHLKKGEAGVETDSDVMVDQLRAVDNRRLRKETGRLTPKRMAEVEGKLRIVLELG